MEPIPTWLALYSHRGASPQLPPPWAENLKSPDEQRGPEQRCSLHGPVYKTCLTFGAAAVGTVVSLWGQEGDASGGWRRCVFS